MGVSREGKPVAMRSMEVGVVNHDMASPGIALIVQVDKE